MEYSDDLTWVPWGILLATSLMLGFVLLVGPASAGGESSQGNANYEDYIDVPPGQVTSYIVNGKEVDYASIQDPVDNATYLDFNGNPITRTPRIYGSVYTHANSSIEYNIATPIWLHYTMPPRFNGTEAPYPIYTLEQGQDVYFDTHYDISNALAGTGVLAWFKDGVPDAVSQPVLIELPYQLRGYYDFYIDPQLFGPYMGNWYKWDGTYRPNENSIAFYLKNTIRNASLTLTNGTVMATNISFIEPNTTFETPFLEQKSPPLPKQYVSDYLIARGDPLSIHFNDTWKMWLFGSTADLLDQRDYNGTVNIGEDVIQRLPVGNYKVIKQEIGPYAKDFMFHYNKEKDAYEWFDPKTFTVKTEPLISIKNTWLTYTKFTEIMPTTQDRYTEYRLELQEPSITINRMDPIGERSAKNFYLMDDVRGNISFEEVRGYTNMAVGTHLIVYLDYLKGARDQKGIDVIVQDNGGPGYTRVYNATVPLYYNELSAGIHTITVMTDRAELGPVTQSDFMINEMPSNTYVPPRTVKWVGDVNPWSLNTTVQPAEVVEQIVEKEVVVTKEVPPSEDVVKRMQMAAIYQVILELIGVASVIGAIVYTRSVYKRMVERKHKSMVERKRREVFNWKR